MLEINWGIWKKIILVKVNINAICDIEQYKIITSVLLKTKHTLKHENILEQAFCIHFKIFHKCVQSYCKCVLFYTSKYFNFSVC